MCLHAPAVYLEESSGQEVRANRQERARSSGVPTAPTTITTEASAQPRPQVAGRTRPGTDPVPGVIQNDIHDNTSPFRTTRLRWGLKSPPNGQKCSPLDLLAAVCDLHSCKPDADTSNVRDPVVVGPASSSPESQERSKRSCNTRLG